MERRGGGGSLIYENKTDFLSTEENRSALFEAFENSGRSSPEFSTNANTPIKFPESANGVVLQTNINSGDIKMSAEVDTLIDSRIKIDLGDRDNTQILLDSRRDRQGDAQLYPPLRFWTATKREDLFAVKGNDVTVGQVFTSWFIDDRDPNIVNPVRENFNKTDPNFPTEYLQFGYWLHADKNNLEQAKVGSFAIGTELVGDSRLHPITASGTATYRGIAGGFLTYDVKTDPDGLFPAEFVEAGDFLADITLEANFDRNSISGCVGCTRGIGLRTLTDRERVPPALRSELAVNQTGHFILLEEAPIDPVTGNFSGRTAAHYWNTGHPYNVVSTEGKWGGSPSTARDDDGHPKMLAGTFSSEWKDNPDFLIPERGPGGTARLFGAWMATTQSAENLITQELIPNPEASPPR